jgi:hypothetical protein
MGFIDNWKSLDMDFQHLKNDPQIKKKYIIIFNKQSTNQTNNNTIFI